MQPTGINPSLVRFLMTTAPDLMTELFTPGRVLEADVVSVFQDKAVLSFGRGVRLEVTLQAPLQEGQRVRVQVQPREGTSQPGQQPQAPLPGQAPPPGSTPLLQGLPKLIPEAPAQAQAQPEAPAQTQTQPAPAPIILKVIGQAPPRADAARPVAPQQPGQAPAPSEAPAQGTTRATPTAFFTPDTAAPAAPVANQPAAQQPGVPQVLWLPIPLPDGNQGWAQIHVQEDGSPKTRAQKGGPVQQVRIWWETPALGPVQVTMEAGAANLAALFTAAAPDSKGALEQSLHELQRRFAQVGFPEARVGCRTVVPGETVEPARIEGISRLDKRL